MTEATRFFDFFFYVLEHYHNFCLSKLQELDVLFNIQSTCPWQQSTDAGNVDHKQHTSTVQQSHWLEVECKQYTVWQRQADKWVPTPNQPGRLCHLTGNGKNEKKEWKMKKRREKRKEKNKKKICKTQYHRSKKSTTNSKLMGLLEMDGTW